MVLGSGNFFAPSVGSFQVPVIPPGVDPDEGEQITVCFSADWLPFIVGALQQLTLQATWSGDDDAILQAQNRAQLLIAMFGSSDGGCISDVCIGRLRYDSGCDCIMQTPPDGGAEVENAGADPRHADVFRFPPVDADDPKCQAAANMVRWLNDLIDEVVLVVDTAGAAEGLIAIILPFVVSLGPFGILIDLVLGAAFLLFSAGATAISAAFDNDAYDALQCIFYCHISSDGSVTELQLAGIQADIAAQIGGLVQTITDGMFFLMGEVGLSNAGVVGDNPSADCDSCGCGWCYHSDDANQLGDWIPEAWAGSPDTLPTYSAGAWQSGYFNNGGHNGNYVHIRWVFAGAITITDAGAFSPDIPDNRNIWVNGNGSLFSGTRVWNNGTWEGGTGVSITSVDIIFWRNIDQGVNPFSLEWVQLSGDGDNPFGDNNC